MGIYGTSHSEEIGITDLNALFESFLYDDLCRLNEEEIKEFLASDERKALEEAGVLGKRTIVRLSKQDELSRRTKVASLQLAKEKNDPLWNALVKVRIKEREYLNKLYSKYGIVGKRTAISAQREYLKKTPNYFTRPLTAKTLADSRETLQKK